MNMPGFRRSGCGAAASALAVLAAAEAAFGQSRVDDTLPKAPEQRQTPDVVSLDLSIGGTYAAGNVDNRALNGTLALSLHPAADHRLFLDLSGSYSEFGSAVVLDRQQGAFLYAYALATHLNAFVYTTHARNRFLKLDYRTDNSLGVCVHSFLPETFSVLLLSLGATPEYERWKGNADDTHVRATLRARVEMPITASAMLGLDATYSPVVAELHAFRMFGSAFGEVKITAEVLALRITANDEYDTRPRPGVKRNDFSVVSSLVVKLAPALPDRPRDSPVMPLTKEAPTPESPTPDLDSAVPVEPSEVTTDEQIAKPTPSDPGVPQENRDGREDHNRAADGGHKIAYWCGKVNLHLVGGQWVTDPDGVSGCDVDKLRYCRKFWPAVTAVQEAGLESLRGFRNRGNRDGPFSTTKMTYRCVGDLQPSPRDTRQPRRQP